MLYNLHRVIPFRRR